MTLCKIELELINEHGLSQGNFSFDNILYQIDNLLFYFPFLKQFYAVSIIIIDIFVWLFYFDQVSEYIVEIGFEIKLTLKRVLIRSNVADRL